MKCKICEIRKPRRYCPGVSGDICAICCGNERERTIDCPLECSYLQEAHDHERAPEIKVTDLPNRDIQVTEQFLGDREALLQFVLLLVLRYSIETPGTVDNDVRAAIESIIRTYRTLASGLVYDSRPVNPVADIIYTRMREGLDELRAVLIEKGTTPRDNEFLGIFVFLQHVELTRNNGRPRSRAFMDFLRRMFPEYKPKEAASPLIVT
ncbi:MAG: hypothetical protein M3Y27_26450 [Acidobacteriota bacterium]|nr:hypothetical protein [Acidobacteriota bacterium]